jgi:myo-inositol-1(or 4)-monophosphatase
VIISPARSRSRVAGWAGRGVVRCYGLTVRLSDAEVAVAAAEAGAAVVRARFGTPMERFEKAPMDFATDVDIEAERAILDILRAARPGDAYQGEELGASGSDASDRAWLIDPLCGTLNFAAQMPMVAVNVALQDGDRIHAAVCADPFAAEVFWTDGRGAFGRRGDFEWALCPSSGTRLVEANLDPPYPNRDQFQAVRMLGDAAFIATFRARVVSTTLALAWVACGRRAGYVTDGNLHGSVHFSSGIALCQAAGCVVTGVQGQPLHTGAGGLVAAADGETHAALIEIISHQLAEQQAGKP